MEEVSSGKMIKRYVIKLLLWFLLIDIVIGGVVLFANLAGIADTDSNDYEAMAGAIKSFLNTVLIVNVVAIVASPLLATRSMKKKYKLTEENKKSVFKGVAIGIVVLAVIMAAVHIGVKSLITNALKEETGIEWSEIGEALDDVDDFLKEHDEIDISDTEFKDMIDIVDTFYGKINLYGMIWILFIVMIGAEYVIIVRKEQVA